MRTELQLTREQRHEVYRLALDFILKDVPPYSLCYAIEVIGHLLTFKPEDWDGFDPEITASYLPELYSYRPDRISEHGYWFDGEDQMSRIAILEQCIEETKEVAHAH